MKFLNILLVSFFIVLTSCSSGSGGGGGTLASTTCSDNNAYNKGEDGYCSCNAGYVLNTEKNSCDVPSAEADNKIYSGVYTNYYPEQTQTTPCSGRLTTTRTLLYCLGSDNIIADNSKCTDSDPTSFVLSRAGSIEVTKTNPSLTNGKEYMQCDAGHSSGLNRYVVCDLNYTKTGSSVGNNNCVPSNFLGTYSSYTPSQSGTTPCSGLVNSTRAVSSCVLVSTGTPVSFSNCVDPISTIQTQSKAGTVAVSATNPLLNNGSEVMTCEIGATTGSRNIACNGGYHIEGTTLSNKNCYSNTKSCDSLPTGTSAGIQEWNTTSSVWGSCVATACSSGYTWSYGVCLSNAISEKLFFIGDSGFKILSDGSVKSWGYNYFSNLGVGDSINKTTPTSVNLGSGKTAKKIVSTISSVCAILNDDSLKCWGSNALGELGVGDTSTKNVPTAVNLGGSIKELIPGSNNFCAILTDGSVKCWGYNQYGELGNGSTTNKTTPTSVNLGSGRTAKKLVMSKKATGSTTCAILDNDSLKCWGRNDYGQFGNGGTINSSTPLLVDLGSGRSAKDVYLFSAQNESGMVSTCVILDDNSLKCWGFNQNARLGVGNSINQLTPQSVNVGSGRTVKKLFYSEIGQSTCAILDNDSLKCWGYNNAYQIGDGTTNTRMSPVAITFPSGKGVKDLIILGLSFYALHTDNSLSVWGNNNYGELGVSVSSLTPVTVDLGSKSINKVVVSNCLSCLLYMDGSVGCAGDNTYRSLGDGSSVGSSSTHVNVNLGSGKIAKELRSYNFATCAVLTDDTVKCWGNNAQGQLGIGSTTNSSTPQLLSL